MADEWTARMMPLRKTLSLLCIALVTIGIGGCTVWGAKNPPTLNTTTSAEQYERITWDNVRTQKWDQITPLLAPNVVYAADGKLIQRDQIAAYLQSRKIRDFAISDMVVKPNGPDMTLSYTVQISTTDGKTQTLLAVSVWQQLKSGWVLTLHAEMPLES
jgi:hypothetical protein